jgi:hypothetical protein
LAGPAFLFAQPGSLLLENLAQRQQLAVLKIGIALRNTALDRCFWMVISRIWSNRKLAPDLSKPETVVEWPPLAKTLSGLAKPRGPVAGISLM